MLGAYSKEEEREGHGDGFLGVTHGLKCQTQNSVPVNAARALGLVCRRLCSVRRERAICLQSSRGRISYQEYGGPTSAHLGVIIVSGVEDGLGALEASHLQSTGYTVKWLCDSYI